MHVELSDAELVRQIRSGSNHDAEAELYRRMAPRVRLYGLRHLRDEHASQDLAQQVLITTLEALREGRLREPEKLVSFVLGTCRMTVLNLKRNAHRKERLLARFGADLVTQAPPPEPRLDHEKLARCVQNLKERERSVVVMTFGNSGFVVGEHGFGPAPLLDSVDAGIPEAQRFRARMGPRRASVHGGAEGRAGDAPLLPKWLITMDLRQKNRFNECKECGCESASNHTGTDLVFSCRFG